MNSSIQKITDDNLFIDEAGPWAVRKYRLVGYYANQFATSMKKKWNNRIYIDLFSSSGYSRIKGTDNIVVTSAIIAADVKEKFDRYIFCEIDPVKLDSLEKRIRRDFPEIDARFLNCDVNNSIDQILEAIPNFSKGFTGLTLCLVDPYKIDNLSFTTIKALSRYMIDFLILIPSFMDVNRNEKNYMHEKSNLVTKFINAPDWRDKWNKYRQEGLTFGTFIVKSLNESMVNNGFIGLENDEFVLIRNPQNNSPLYHLAFYRKSQLGIKFWNNARKGTTDQLEFF